MLAVSVVGCVFYKDLHVVPAPVQRDPDVTIGYGDVYLWIFLYASWIFIIFRMLYDSLLLQI